MDLTTYAELAVRLVNTASYSEDNVDRLATMDGLRDLVADREHLSGSGATRRDLEALRGLRTEFRKVFAACAAGDGDGAAAQLNSLLIRHPVHPQLSGHDGQPWHVHFTESGTVADKYAAGAAMGLAIRLTGLGPERFGACQAPPRPGRLHRHQHQPVPALLLRALPEPGQRDRFSGAAARAFRRDRNRTVRRGLGIPCGRFRPRHL